MSENLDVPKLTFWRTVVAVIFIVGIYAAYLRFFTGWQVSTNLTDAQPWGLWVGFGTLCGVGLSAARFRDCRGCVSARHGALSPGAEDFGAAFVPRLFDGLHRHAL